MPVVRIQSKRLRSVPCSRGSSCSFPTRLGSPPRRFERYKEEGGPPPPAQDLPAFLPGTGSKQLEAEMSSQASSIKDSGRSEWGAEGKMWGSIWGVVIDLLSAWW